MARETSTAHHASVPVGGSAKAPPISQSSARCFSSSLKAATVGLHRPTGLDFVSWYAERLRSQAVVRENLPVIGTESDKAAHLHRLREAWE
jgi:hypothetical protein